ncbi:MAG TPA: 4Fe-4S dicluster domain-containing protein [Bacteroidales bacterium]|nr:4Fe-4S dicluster domain-containing protein [Bacteroidales bacterium]
MSPKKLDLNRRDFLKAGATAVVSLAAITAGVTYVKKVVGKDIRSQEFLRPPGAVAESDFIYGCIKCGLCVQICPVQAITLAGISRGLSYGTPYLDVRQQACDFSCDSLQCVETCPTGVLDFKQFKAAGEKAIIAFEEEQGAHHGRNPFRVQISAMKESVKMGKARLNPQTCLAALGQGFTGTPRGEDFRGVNRTPARGGQGRGYPLSHDEEYDSIQGEGDEGHLHEGHLDEGHGRGEGRGSGEGYGRGQGRGEGRGQGRGYGEGQGRGEGRGYGEGQGRGEGRSYGEGQGRGEGRGYGEGQGRGRDENADSLTEDNPGRHLDTEHTDQGEGPGRGYNDDRYGQESEESYQTKASPVREKYYERQLCDLCVTECPIGCKAIVMNKLKDGSGNSVIMPEVLDGCTGCGVCVMVCPTAEPSIIVEPIKEQAYV